MRELYDKPLSRKILKDFKGDCPPFATPYDTDTKYFNKKLNIKIKANKQYDKDNEYILTGNTKNNITIYLEDLRKSHFECKVFYAVFDNILVFLITNKTEKSSKGPGLILEDKDLDKYKIEKIISGAYEREIQAFCSMADVYKTLYIDKIKINNSKENFQKIYENNLNSSKIYSVVDLISMDIQQANIKINEITIPILEEINDGSYIYYDANFQKYKHVILR